MPLSLSRKPLQSVIITHADKPEIQIVVRVDSLANGQARLSFDAPDEYLIYREEIIPNKDR